MKYRVLFAVDRGIYYTEWFDTRAEADKFVVDAREDNLHVVQIEDEDGEVI